MIVCAKCYKPLNPQDPHWQRHPFGIHYCWEYELKDDWYHHCYPNLPPKDPRKYGYGIDTEELNREEKIYDE